MPCAGTGPSSLTYLEIDKLADGRYRAPVGTLFEHQEICRTRDLEALVRQSNAMAGCRSFEDVVDALAGIGAVADSRELARVTQDAAVSAVAFSPDGKSLATASWLGGGKGEAHRGGGGRP